MAGKACSCLNSSDGHPQTAFRTPRFCPKTSSLHRFFFIWARWAGTPHSWSPLYWSPGNSSTGQYRQPASERESHRWSWLRVGLRNYFLYFWLLALVIPPEWEVSYNLEGTIPKFKWRVNLVGVEYKQGVVTLGDVVHELNTNGIYLITGILSYPILNPYKSILLFI